MTEKTRIKNRERARKWYQDNRQRKLDYERERLNKGKILQDRIDKAIKFIEEDLIPYGNEYHWDNASLEDIVKDLLNILKGDDK